MSIFVERINSAPLEDTDFPMDFEQWIANLIDSLNEAINVLEDSINFFTAQSFTTAEITAIGANLSDGIIIYNSDTDEYVGKSAGSLVKFTVTPYP